MRVWEALTTKAATSAVLTCAVSLLHHPTAALFLRPQSSIIHYPSLKLAKADEMRIPYKSIAYDASSEASNPGFALSLNAEFGPLDAITFLGLQEAYCGWSETKSRVKWREGMSYTLLDFLPPLMQAVSGLYFRSTRRKQFGLPSFLGGPYDDIEEFTEQQVLLACNCWGFAWEALYQADNKDVYNMQISTADPTSAWRAFTGPGFVLVQSTRSNSNLLTDADLRNKRLKAGDTLLIWHQIPNQSNKDNLYLDHVAIVLDDDVYYEKSGSGDAVPFRVTTWEGITANFPPGVFEWEWRRLVRNQTPLGNGENNGNNNGKNQNQQQQPKLQPASERFGLDKQFASSVLSKKRFNLLENLRPSVAKRFTLQTSQDENGAVEAHTYTGIYVLEDLVFDRQTGRASLPPSAFMESYFQMPDLPTNPYWGIRS